MTIRSDADAIALWQAIAPTTEDWQAKLDEIDELPVDGSIVSRLALALLRGGNFTCVPPAARSMTCGPTDVDLDSPPPSATFSDPCLRRRLAFWALNALDEPDIDAARDALKGIVSIPPPESQLIDTALDVLPETDHVGQLELLALAFKAGHRDIVNARLRTLDTPHLVEAVQKHHIDGPLDMLTADLHLAVFLGAIADEALDPGARAQAMIEVASLHDTAGAKLPGDIKVALAKATRSNNCSVAAAAQRVLVGRGEKRFAPVRPATHKPATMMRALCVLASYEQMQHADEASYLLGYVPRKGLEIVKVAYDVYSEHDADGDGNVHTERTTTLVPRNEVVLPELEDLVRAFKSCKGTMCTTPDREFKLGLRPGPGGDLLLHRIEVVERPPCVPAPPAVP